MTLYSRDIPYQKPAIYVMITFINQKCNLVYGIINIKLTVDMSEILVMHAKLTSFLLG